MASPATLCADGLLPDLSLGLNNRNYEYANHPQEAESFWRRINARVALTTAISSLPRNGGSRSNPATSSNILASPATLCADGLFPDLALYPNNNSRYMNHHPHGAESLLRILYARAALARPINSLPRNDYSRKYPGKPTNSTTISPPTTILCSSEGELRSDTLDNDIKPISLDDFDVQQEEGSYNDAVDDEQDWTRKITFVASSSGDLIEDFEADDSSTSSMTTIIGSEHSYVADATDLGDDLEDIFNPQDETDQVAEKRDNDCKNTDPLHSKTFVVFGTDDYVNNIRETPSKTNTTPIKGPKTSKINPMTGQRSLTDDMQEWRRNVLSSFRLVTPKPRKRKYNKKKSKTPVKPHTYPLRRGSSKNDTTQESVTISPLKASASNPVLKKSRLLRAIAPYNLPGIKNAYGYGSVSPDAEPTVESNNASATTPQRKESFPGDKDKIVAPIFRGLELDTKSNTTARIKTCALKKLASYNAPGFKNMDDNFLDRAASNRLKNDNTIVNSGSNNTILTAKPPNATIRPPRLIKNQCEQLQKRGEKRMKSPGGLQTAAAATRLVSNENAGKEQPITKNYVKEKASSTKTIQKKNITQRSTTQPKKATYPRGKRDADATTKLSIRIAKKFLFKPSGSKGRELAKTYFGTIVSKREVTGVDQTYRTIWHVVYDDNDEEDFNKREYQQALNLYNASNDLDDKRNDRPSMQSEEIRKDPQITENTTRLSQSSNEHNKTFLEKDGHSKAQNGSPLPQHPTYADTVTRNLTSAKNNKGEKIERSDFGKRQIDVSKKRKHSNQQQGSWKRRLRK